MEEIRQLKRKCLLCNGRRYLKPDDGVKNEVRAGLEALREHFRAEFNELRAKDAELEQIDRARENKSICADAIDTCRHCGREEDRVNRLLNKIQ